MKSFNIPVTQRAIDETIPRNSRHCTAAQALRLAGAWSVDIDASMMRFNMGEMRYCFPTPAKIAMMAEEVDTDGKDSIKPFIMRLSGSQGFCKPVARRGAVGPYGPRKKRKGSKPTVRWTKRRWAGLKVARRLDEAPPHRGS